MTHPGEQFYPQGVRWDDAIARGTLPDLLSASAAEFGSRPAIEFRNFATRPKTINGIGLTVAEAEAKSAVFEAAFTLLPETPDIYPAWKQLVTALGVIGKQVHDARLVAVCQVNRVTHVLTFNTGDFVSLAKSGTGLTIVDPANV